MSNKTNISKHVANLVSYAKDKLGLNYYDAVYAQNSLLAELKLTEPAVADEVLPDFQTGIIDKIVDYAVENGLKIIIKEGCTNQRFTSVNSYELSN